MAVLGVALFLWTPLGDLLTKERMIELLEQVRSSPWTPPLVVAGFVVSTPLGLPVSPLVIGSGFVFGPIYGSILNIGGMALAAMVGYFVARALGREFIVRLAGPRLKRAERIFQRHAFWPLVQVRFLPIPFAMVSYGAALAGVRAWPFFLASLIGLTPATAIHTYFGPALIKDPDLVTFLLYVLSMVLLNVIAGWKNLREGWGRRQRYRLLLEERRTARAGSQPHHPPANV
jgi:uncharacterized membrane protein YdjX (TVP38/TMEM64 family)